MISRLFILFIGVLCVVGCTVTDVNEQPKASIFPASDPNNRQGWVLNTQVSDEFNGEEIDQDKWFVQGTDQQFYLWKGRAPSQFAPHNVRLEDGYLKLRTQWQPDYPFVGKPPQKQEIKTYENITTAAVISHQTFLYGYMEVRVKIPDAAMTGAFWGTGHEQELDVFELIGRVKTGSRAPETTFVTSIHDWRPGHPKKNKVWKHPHKMSGRTAEAFHIYGVEWLPDGLKMYLDGELVYHATQQEMGDAWLLNNPLELWLDSEVFPWHGIPEADELPVDFEIDYVRVWQKPDANLLQPAFFGFEGPWSAHAVRKPNSRKTAYKHWWMDDTTAQFIRITEDLDFEFATGRNSLAFQFDNSKPKQELTVYSPEGSVQLAPGKYELKLSVKVRPGTQVQALNLILESPWQALDAVDLTAVPKDQWVEVSVPFERVQASLTNDRLRVVIKPQDVQGQSGKILIDDIKIYPVSTKS